MLQTVLLPRVDAVAERLQCLGKDLLIHLDGHAWHSSGVVACHAVSPFIQLDFDAASSPDLWRRWRAQYNPLGELCFDDSLTGPLPGWYGYLGYEAGRSPLIGARSRKTAGALPVASIGFYPCIVAEFPRHTEIRFIDGHQAVAEKIVQSLMGPAPQHPPFSLVTPFMSDVDEATYRQGFERIIDYILAGDCYQVNYAQRFSARYSGSPGTVHAAIHAAMNSPFSGFARHANGSILCYSPEQFVSLHNGEIKTSPIKGTRPRANDSQQDQQLRQQLESSTKDRAENLMIVDLLRNDVSRVAQLGSVTVPDLFKIDSYTHVHHMVSTVTARLAPAHDALDVLQSCFPGGSITGAPKRRACEIIDELEAFARDAYCGSLFYIDIKGNMQSNILIRTLVAETGVAEPGVEESGHLYCWGGGGIVADSDWRTEYEETLHKVGRLMALFEESLIRNAKNAGRP